MKRIFLVAAMLLIALPVVGSPDTDYVHRANLEGDRGVLIAKGSTPVVTDSKYIAPQEYNWQRDPLRHKGKLYDIVFSWWLGDRHDK
jgi:hypothetical protein